jgi:hypothetical protein
MHIFLEEDLHNVTLQEEATKLEMVVRIREDYIARGARVHLISVDSRGESRV